MKNTAVLVHRRDFHSLVVNVIVQLTLLPSRNFGCTGSRGKHRQQKVAFATQTAIADPTLSGRVQGLFGDKRDPNARDSTNGPRWTDPTQVALACRS